MNPETMGGLFDPGMYNAPYMQEPPPGWQGAMPRFSIEGNLQQPTMGAGVDVPFGQGTLGVEGWFTPGGERYIGGSYRRQF